MKRSILVILGVVILIGGLGALGILPKLRRQDKVKAETQAQANTMPGVHIHLAGQSEDTLGLQLPGRIEALQATDLYARAEGYVQRWTADIGTKVRQGQILATITQPELDQDIIAARTQAELARANLKRLEDVSLPGAISAAELDQARAQYKSAQASLARVQDLKSFQQITAPFDGVITARNVEVGAYVQPGAAALFSMQGTGNLRVFADVPQSELAGINVEGGQALVIIPELGGKRLPAEIVRNSGAVDEASRTLTVQLVLPQVPGVLPGMYCQVSFPPGSPSPTAGPQPISIPANTMYYSSQGPAVLVVDKAGRVHLHPIKIGRDQGTTVQVSSGISLGDQLVINPNSRLLEGMQVKVLPAEAKPAPKS